MADEIKSLRDAIHETRQNGYKEIDVILASGASAEEKAKQVSEKKAAMNAAERELKGQINGKKQ
jgi:hypothetical protein